MGYYDEKQKYEELKKQQNWFGGSGQQNKFITNCGHCGVNLKEGDAIKCQKLHFNTIKRFICKDCAKKCKKCEKYFCPKHIHNHGCFLKL